MIESVNDNAEGVFASVVRVVGDDPALCNYLRYMDYGNIGSSSGYLHWESKKDPIANADNWINNTQLIRFVPSFTGKFMQHVTQMVESSNDYRSEAFIGFVKELGPFTDPNSYSRDYNYYAEHLLDLTINLDHTFKCLGKSLTILDFIGKNRNPIQGEFSRMTAIYRSVNKYLVVGDQCFLIALVMRNGTVYVDTRILTSIWKKSPDVFKRVVKNLVLFVIKNTMDTTNLSISQIMENDVKSPIIRMLQNREAFQGIDIGNMAKTKSILAFSTDNATENQITNMIEGVISKCVKNYINTHWRLDSFAESALPTMVNRVRTGLQQYFNENSKTSYERGFKIGRVIESCGWHIMSESDKQNSGCVSFASDGCYIARDVDIYPKDAVLYVNHGTEHRVLKDEYLKEFYDSTGIRIRTLYIDVYTGKMYARGSHPNVSGSGVVCMGDIAGKVNFTDASVEQIPEILMKCEDLLRSINYTSAYTDRGLHFFTSETKSMKYMDPDSIQNTKDELTDVVDADTDTYTDAPEEEETQQNNAEDVDEEELEFEEEE